MTNAYLRDHHHAFRIKEDINEICKPLFKNTPINGFVYEKGYRNGDAILLTTFPEFFQLSFEKNYPFTWRVPKAIISDEFWYYTDKNGPYSQLIADVNQIFNIYYPIDFLSVTDNYFELFAFGCRINDPSMIGFYLNHVETLHKFRSYFKDKASQLIADADNYHKIYVPPSLRTNVIEDYVTLKNESNYINKLKHEFEMQHRELHYNGKCIKLTKREADVLCELASGYSLKVASNTLNLSYRTVESYLKNIKNKLGCVYKNQVVDIFNKNRKNN